MNAHDGGSADGSDKSAAMTAAVKTTAAVTAKPASDSSAAIQARVRAMVLVTKASGSPTLRHRRSAAAAPQAASTTRLGREPRLRNKFRKLRPLPSRTRATEIT